MRPRPLDRWTPPRPFRWCLVAPVALTRSGGDSSSSRSGPAYLLAESQNRLTRDDFRRPNWTTSGALMGLRDRRARHISRQCRTRRLGHFESTAQRFGRSSWRPGPPRQDRTARNARGNWGDGPHRIYRCDRSDRYGAVEPARDRATCSDCGGSCRRDTPVSGGPVSIRDVPLERRSHGIDDLGINPWRQTAIVRAGCGPSVERPSRRDWKAGGRRSHDATSIRALRGEHLVPFRRTPAACLSPGRLASRGATGGYRGPALWFAVGTLGRPRLPGPR